MALRLVLARALLQPAAWAPAPAAAAAIAAVLSRRLFSNTTRGGGRGRGAHVDKRIERTKEELLELYKGKTPAPAAEEVAADLTGVLRRFEAAKSTPGQEQHGSKTFVGDSFAGDSFVGDSFVGEPFAGEHFDTEPYEADGSVDGYSFSGGTYEGDSHSGDIYTPWVGRETRRGGD
ncbi:hypothetical protein VPH35_004325 [Triticum aestivum]|uniref:Uncharacterized protein n=1 Tax=Triticum turgidum subsp. durum TaxID=4567 RepID=A0A9R0V2J1_TRITD|nr:unnamed protein product [Triticum turgidum subsp. durum]